MRFRQSVRECQDSANREILAVGTIEHIDALSTLHEVVAVPGLDLRFIGPSDLATSRRLGGRIDHPAVQSAIASFEKIVLPSPIPLGGRCSHAGTTARHDRPRL